MVLQVAGATSSIPRVVLTPIANVICKDDLQLPDTTRTLSHLSTNLSNDTRFWSHTYGEYQ
jgi:hypothetical protein